MKFLSLFLALIAVLVLAGCTYPTTPVCGNNLCEGPTETQYTCPLDCGQPPIICTDSDGGLNIYAKGTVTYDGTENTDFCLPVSAPADVIRTAVMENFCEAGKPRTQEAVCPSGYICTDGACVQVPVPVKTITIVDGKGYPYDANDTSGVYSYVANLTSSANGLQKIKIVNSKQNWSSSSPGNGPLYPTNSEQSLTGKTGQKAVFGQPFPDSTAGKGFVNADFSGFTGAESRTAVTISNSLTGLDSAAKGGINFKGVDGTTHNIPLALKLSDSQTGNTFSFDGKTIYYDVNYGKSSSAGTSFDLNFNVRTADYVNGRQWKLFGTSYLQIAGISGSFVPGSFANVDGVTYKVLSITGSDPVAVVAVDGKITFRKENPNGSLIYNTYGDVVDDSYGRMYFTDGGTLSAPTLISGAQTNLGIPGNGDRKTYYAVKVGQNVRRLWLLLNYGPLGTDEGNKIQNGKQVVFQGTAVPRLDGAETGVVNATYYVPQDSDFNVSDIYSRSDAYFVAEFNIVDVYPNGFPQSLTNIHIDTKNAGNLGPFPNSTLTYYSSDLDYLGTPAWKLTSGTQGNYLKAAYTDSGTRAWLLENDSGVSISMPQNQEQIEFNVCDGSGNPGNCKQYRSALNSGTGAANIEVPNANDFNALTNSQLAILINNGTAQEKIGINMDAKMNTSSDIKDLVTNIESGDFYYEVSSKTPIIAGTCLPFFGKYYKVVEVQLSGVKQVTLEETQSCSSSGGGSSAGSGFSEVVPIGN